MKWEEKFLSRLNRLRIIRSSHLTGQVGQAGVSGILGFFVNLIDNSATVKPGNLCRKAYKDMALSATGRRISYIPVSGVSGRR